MNEIHNMMGSESYYVYIDTHTAIRNLFEFSFTYFSVFPLTRHDFGLVLRAGKSFLRAFGQGFGPKSGPIYFCFFF